MQGVEPLEKKRSWNNNGQDGVREPPFKADKRKQQENSLTFLFVVGFDPMSPGLYIHNVLVCTKGAGAEESIVWTRGERKKEWSFSIRTCVPLHMDLRFQQGQTSTGTIRLKQGLRSTPMMTSQFLTQTILDAFGQGLLVFRF